MKINGLTACLILLLAAACAAPAGVPRAAPTASATLPPASTVTPTPSTAAVPAVASPEPARPDAIATSRFPDGPTSTPTVPAIKTPVSPATTATASAGPSPMAPIGWKTFTSTKLRAALDYPSTWTAREDSTGVTLTPPSGATIVLAGIDTGNGSPEDYLAETLLPNMRCSTGVNAHGLSVRACIDTVAFAHVAYIFLKPASGSERLLSLSTRTRDPLDVFNAMLASIHPLA